MTEPADITEARRAYYETSDKLDLAILQRGNAQQRYADAQAALDLAEQNWSDAMAATNRAYDQLVSVVSASRALEAVALQSSELIAAVAADRAGGDGTARRVVPRSAGRIDYMGAHRAPLPVSPEAGGPFYAASADAPDYQHPEDDDE